jgi:hypothetical protein
MRPVAIILLGGLLAITCTGRDAGAQDRETEERSESLTVSEEMAVEKFLSLKVAEVKSAMESSNCDHAIQLIDAILLLKPDTQHRRELKDLRIIASQKKLQQEVVRVYIYCSKKLHKAGEAIDICIRVKNIGSDTVTFPHSGNNPRNLGFITKKTYDYRFPCSSRMRGTQVMIKQDSPIVLQKSQVWEKCFEIDTSGMDAGMPTVRRYILQVELRPTEIVAGRGQFSRYLSSGEIELWVVPGEYESLVQNPMEHFKEASLFLLGKPAPGELAIDDESTARLILFYCTFLLDEHDRVEALPTLISVLEKASGDTAMVVMGLLSFLTDEDFGTSREDWLDWWKRSRE